MHGISLRGHRTCLALRAISDCWVILMEGQLVQVCVEQPNTENLWKQETMF